MALRALAIVLVLLSALAVVPPQVVAGPAAPARALVSLHGGPDALAPALAPSGGRVVEAFPFAGVALVEAPPAALAALRGQPWVAGVYPEEPLQMALASSRPAVRAGPALWDAGIDGAGVAVAVVDSGIDQEHPGLRGRVLRAVHLDDGGARPGGGDDDGHGTHIAGIIAGNGEGSAQRRHAGMAPAAGLVAVDISDAFTTTNAVRAFGWLLDNARDLNLRVVSNSWGREKAGAFHDPDDPVARAADALVRSGVVVVFSAGNRGPGPSTLTVEAQNPNVLTVGATDDEGRVEGYSSRGPAKLRDGSDAPWAKPDVVAPGTAITSARAGAARGGEAYITLNGTSMAAPHVAGVAAALLASNPALSPADVKELLGRTARDTGAPGADLDAGAGMLDALAAAGALSGAPDGPAPPPERATFHDAGRVTPAAAALPPGTSPAPAEVRRALVVPEGALSLAFSFRWDDPRASFAVTLEKAGRVLGPFEGAARRGAWQVIEGEFRDGLEPGTWVLVARPRGTSASLAANYVVDGEVLVLSARPAPGAPRFQPSAAAPPDLAGSDGASTGEAALWAAGALATAGGMAWLAQRVRSEGEARARPLQRAARAGPAAPHPRLPARLPARGAVTHRGDNRSL